jgi:TolB protein
MRNSIHSFTIFFLSIFCCSVLNAQNKIGIFDAHGDVGTNVKPGSATYIPETQQYIIYV